MELVSIAIGMLLLVTFFGETPFRETVFKHLKRLPVFILINELAHIETYKKTLQLHYQVAKRYEFDLIRMLMSSRTTYWNDFNVILGCLKESQDFYCQSNSLHEALYKVIIFTIGSGLTGFRNQCRPRLDAAECLLFKVFRQING